MICRLCPTNLTGGPLLVARVTALRAFSRLAFCSRTTSDRTAFDALAALDAFVAMESSLVSRRTGNHAKRKAGKPWCTEVSFNSTIPSLQRGSLSHVEELSHAGEFLGVHRHCLNQCVLKLPNGERLRKQPQPWIEGIIDGVGSKELMTRPLGSSGQSGRKTVHLDAIDIKCSASPPDRSSAFRNATAKRRSVLSDIPTKCTASVTTATGEMLPSSGSRSGKSALRTAGVMA